MKKTQFCNLKIKPTHFAENKLERTQLTFFFLKWRIWKLTGPYKEKVEEEERDKRGIKKSIHCAWIICVRVWEEDRNQRSWVWVHQHGEIGETPKCIEKRTEMKIGAIGKGDYYREREKGDLLEIGTDYSPKGFDFESLFELAVTPLSLFCRRRRHFSVVFRSLTTKSREVTRVLALDSTKHRPWCLASFAWTEGLGCWVGWIMGPRAYRVS